nr:hypothetical protein [Tanacetum cinerariifolium]
MRAWDHPSPRLFYLGLLRLIPTEIPIIPTRVPKPGVTIVALPAGVFDLSTYSSTDSYSSEDPPAPEHAPIAPAISLFLHSFDSFETSRDFAVSGLLERPPSLDPYEVTVARWRSRLALRSSSPTHALPFIVITLPVLCRIVPALPGVPRRPAILFLPGQKIPLGQPYRTQPNRVLKMMNMRKRVRPLPSRHIASRHSSYYSSLDSLSERSSHLVTSHSLSLFVGPSRKRCRSLITYVPLVIPAQVDLSPTHADLLPPCKRFRSSSAALSPEASIKGSMEIGSEDEDIDSNVMADIEADITAEAAAAIEFRTVVDVGIVEHVVPDDILVPIADEVSREYFQIGLDVVIQELYDHITMPTTTRSGLTPAVIEEIITQSMAESIEAYDANQNQEPVMESRNGQEDDHGDNHRNGGGNGNGGDNENGNGNGMGRGNRDGNPNMNVENFVPVVRECTY